jgi:hypothetical protein
MSKVQLPSNSKFLPLPQEEIPKPMTSKLTGNFADPKKRAVTQALQDFQELQATLNL